MSSKDGREKGKGVCVGRRRRPSDDAVMRCFPFSRPCTAAAVQAIAKSLCKGLGPATATAPRHSAPGKAHMASRLSTGPAPHCTDRRSGIPEAERAAGSCAARNDVP